MKLDKFIEECYMNIPGSLSNFNFKIVDDLFFCVNKENKVIIICNPKKTDYTKEKLYSICKDGKNFVCVDEIREAFK